MALALATTNVLHGLVALAWLAGLRRAAGPLPAELTTRLHVAAVVLPPCIALLRLLGAPSPAADSMVLRASRWAEAFTASSWLLLGAAALLFVGTTTIFLLQEALPAWRHRQRYHHLARSVDPKLDATLRRLVEAFDHAGVAWPRGRRPHILKLETQEPLAALAGISEPVILVSAGLVAALEEDELEAVVAHELAHAVRAGNTSLLLVWGVRLLQAFNPATLVLFRNLVDAREAACDELAVSITERPAALASALLKSRQGRGTRSGHSALSRARAQVLRSADRAAVRLRVEALLHRDGRGLVPTVVSWAAVATLGGLLWFVG